MKIGEICHKAGKKCESKTNYDILLLSALCLGILILHDVDETY